MSTFVNNCCNLRLAPLLAGLALSPCVALGSLKDDVGYTELSDFLGVTLPDGSGIEVFQAEAENPIASGNWIADSSNSEFTGKLITPMPVGSSPGASSHATTVGRLFYGNSSSLTPGITVIHAYEANGWLNALFNNLPLGPEQRVANHSWVGSTNTAADAVAVIKRSDWHSEEYELFQTYGTANNNALAANVANDLMGPAFNGVVAGVTDGSHATAVVGLDSIYVANRAPVQIVVPATNVSRAAPVISSAAALLAAAAKLNPGWSVPASPTPTFFNAEKVETIKAALMAGAARSTSNTTALGNIVDYRYSPANHAENGLDLRYGAGQLNIANSYAILAAGEKPSVEEGGANNAGFVGFDYDAAFGGSNGSNDIATYDLGVTESAIDLTVSLVWNLHIEGFQGPNFNDTASLYNIDLALIDVTAGNIIVASSSSEVDNTENIWFTLKPNTHYQLQVKKADTQSNFNFDYSIAWFESEPTININVPMPPLATLTVLLTLCLLYRYRKNQQVRV